MGSVQECEYKNPRIRTQKQLKLISLLFIGSLVLNGSKTTDLLCLYGPVVPG